MVNSQSLNNPLLVTVALLALSTTHCEAFGAAPALIQPPQLASATRSSRRRRSSSSLQALFGGAAASRQHERSSSSSSNHSHSRGPPQQPPFRFRLALQRPQLSPIQSIARDSQPRLGRDGVEFGRVGGVSHVSGFQQQFVERRGGAHEHSRHGALLFGVGAGTVARLSHQFGVPAVQCE